MRLPVYNMDTRRTNIAASTLPELLVTMIVGGILLLAIFDGVDLIRKSIGPVEVMDFGEELSRLQEEEILEDRPDTVSVVIEDHVHDE